MYHILMKRFLYYESKEKIKRLPLGKYETAGVERVSTPKKISRRFPIKSMFLGVVTRPIPHRNFDGRILLERVSKQTTVSKLTTHTNFSDHILINSAIKKGEWKDLFQGNKELTIGEIIDTISLYYGLEEYISDRMEQSF